MSRQPSIFISVDLPEPLGPMTATNSPRLNRQVHAAQRLERSIAPAIGLGQPAQLDQSGVAACGNHDVAGVVAARMMTGMPFVSPSPETSVKRPSVRPVLTGERHRLAIAGAPRCARSPGSPSPPEPASPLGFGPPPLQPAEDRA